MCWIFIWKNNALSVTFFIKKVRHFASLLYIYKNKTLCVTFSYLKFIVSLSRILKCHLLVSFLVHFINKAISVKKINVNFQGHKWILYQILTNSDVWSFYWVQKLGKLYLTTTSNISPWTQNGAFIAIYPNIIYNY